MILVYKEQEHKNLEEKLKSWKKIKGKRDI